MYLMNSSIYFSVKGREFFVFLYLHFFNVEKKIGSLDQNWTLQILITLDTV